MKLQHTCLRMDTALVASVSTLVLATGGIAANCYLEIDQCTVCSRAGANIPCPGGEDVDCADELLVGDAPYRLVVQTTQGYNAKRSENYGSCEWQPRKPNPDPDPEPKDPPCVNDGPPRSKANVMGEETHGGDCNKTVDPPVED